MKHQLYRLTPSRYMECQNIRSRMCEFCPLPPSTSKNQYWDMPLMVGFLYLQHYLYELVIKTLVQHNLFYMLHQFLQYHVLSDSKPLVRKANCFNKLVIEVGCLQTSKVISTFALGLSVTVPGKHLPSCTSALSGHVKSKHFKLRYLCHIRVRFVKQLTWPSLKWLASI